MRKNRILLMTDDMPQGGAERQLSYLAIEFKKRGFEVNLVKFYPGKNYYERDLIDNGIETIIAPHTANCYIRAFGIAKIIKKLNPDLVVTYKDGASMGACLAKCLINFNLVVSERNTTQKLSVKERIKYQLYRFANSVVPNSFSQQKFINTNAHWLSNKVSVITNMVDMGKYSPLRHKYSNNPRCIITLARVAPQKNVLNYLLAIAIVKDSFPHIHFDWYGRIEFPDYFDEIKKNISLLAIEDMITFHGDTKDVVNAYRNADFFCLPSSYEGFPNVLCEAMACGLPCIASNVCDNPNILTDKKRLFDPSSPEDIAAKILKLLRESNDSLQSEGMINRSRIVKMCSPDTFIEKYIGLIGHSN